MNRDRLLIQIDVLRQIEFADPHFDMDAWIKVNDLHPCQSTCCAFGYAALDQRLRDQGLTLRARDVNGTITIHDMAHYNELARAQKIAPSSVWPHHDGMTGFDAAMTFYGITAGAANYLFDPAYYHFDPVRPEHVIARIEEVMANDGDMPSIPEPEEPEEEDEDVFLDD